MHGFTIITYQKAPLCLRVLSSNSAWLGCLHVCSQLLQAAAPLKYCNAYAGPLPPGHALKSARACRCVMSSLITGRPIAILYLNYLNSSQKFLNDHVLTIMCICCGRLRSIEASQRQLVSQLQHLGSQHAAAIRSVSTAKLHADASAAQLQTRKEQVGD